MGLNLFFTLNDTEDNNYSILVVDDEPSFRKVMKRLLNLEGHRVTLAEDGIDGLRILKQKEFDMVLTDINMPKMNGWEFLRNIEKLYPGLPAAVITGLSSQQILRFGDTTLARKILIKPITIKKIRKLIEEIL